MRAMQATHHKLATITDPVVKLNLAKHCLGEGKVQHCLRMYGADLIDAANDADRTMFTVLNRIATGLTEFGRKQATLGTKLGGMRLRQLRHLALPAELAAKLTARPRLVELSDARTTAGVAANNLITQHLDSIIAQLTQTSGDTLDPPERQAVPQLIHVIAERGRQEWHAARHGAPATSPQPLAAWRRPSQDEHEWNPNAAHDPEDQSPCTANTAQRLPCQIQDNSLSRHLHLILEEHESHKDIERLAELRQPRVDHQWAYHIDPSAGTVLPPDMYRDALRHWLGCMCVPEAIACHCCKQQVDVQRAHAGCCATAEAARGHYAIARTIPNVAKTIDPSTTKEEVSKGAERLRPGDITTGAIIDSKRVAVDV